MNFPTRGNDQILLSVVIPARNEECTLPQTLPLVLEQLDELRDQVEVLVVIPDDSPFVVSPPISDARLTWVTTPVPGKHEAMKRGVAAARADVLIFMDADVAPRPGALARLQQAMSDPTVSAAAGRIVLGRSDGTRAQRALEYWTSISFESWHRLRAERPELRWSLPGALYAIRRQTFPVGDLLVPALDDASIGLHVFDAGGRIAYIEGAEVEVGATRSLSQWIRQKRRIRQGWHELKMLRPLEVAHLQKTLSEHTTALCEGRPGAKVLYRADRAAAFAIERTYSPGRANSGAWSPDRNNWTIRTDTTN